MARKARGLRRRLLDQAAKEAGDPDPTDRQERRLGRLSAQRAEADPVFSTLAVDIDLAEIARLKAALRDVSQNFETNPIPLMRGINKGVDRLFTELKRDLQRWTGLRRQAVIKKGLRKKRASKSRLEGSVEVSSPYTKITGADYGAKFDRGDPGVFHAAWNVPQVAKGAFMIAKFDTAYKRVGKGRWDIRQLYGPNLARELERHAPFVRARKKKIIARDVMPEAFRQIEVLLKSSKATHGL